MGQWKITAVHTQAAEKIYIRGEKRMGKEKITDQAMHDFYGKMPLKRAIPLGLQHVLAMFVGNLTPLLIICGACGISGSEEFAHLQVCLLQNAMFVAGVVTLVQLYAIGPIGGKFRSSWEPAPVSSEFSRVWRTLWAADSPPMARSWERQFSAVF